MNAMTSSKLPAVTSGWAAGVAVLTVLLIGCHKAPSTDDKAPATAAEAPARSASSAADAKDSANGGKAVKDAQEGVSLEPEEIAAMGIETQEARAISSAPEAPGFGVVLAHEAIAQSVAEVRTAVAAARQSHSALERSKRLAGTPGALPADTQEAAERQAIADEAALELAQQRLSSSFGQNPPWKNGKNDTELMSLASGQDKLVHATFALGALGTQDPTSIRFARIDATQGGTTWRSSAVWSAPADATVPGRSYFAILKNSGAGEGEHLLAYAPVGEPQDGVLLPSSAAVISAGKFWCYVQKKTGTFVRVEFDPGRPTADGYFVTAGISAGDRVVTAAAGQLLARELNPGKEAE